MQKEKISEFNDILTKNGYSNKNFPKKRNKIKVEIKLKTKIIAILKFHLSVINVIEKLIKLLRSLTYPLQLLMNTVDRL